MMQLLAKVPLRAKNQPSSRAVRRPQRRHSPCAASYFSLAAPSLAKERTCRAGALLSLLQGEGTACDSQQGIADSTCWTQAQAGKLQLLNGGLWQAAQEAASRRRCTDEDSIG